MAFKEPMYATFVGIIDAGNLAKITGGMAAISQQPNVTTLHLMFQSTGGNVADGVSLHNYLRGYPLDLHIYNTGTVSSIAVHSYLGAKNRHVSKHANFMIHKSSMGAQAGISPVKLRQLADTLILEDVRSEAILKTETKIPDDRWDLHAVQDVFFNSQEAIDFGIAQRISEWQVPAGNSIFNLNA